MSSVLTVSQLNKYVAFKLKSDVKLKGICVKGEISNFVLNRSGHAYFSVKDSQSCVKAVMFAGNFSRMKTEISEGMNVLVTGNVELYEIGGTYQIIVTDITPLGSGLVHMQIDAIKAKLAKQGVFDQSKKKPIPLFPKNIAVISSSTGAALQDILSIIQRRFPICSVSVFHTCVQGVNAAQDICRSLSMADNGEYDTIIIARGGGSLEDLMPFNSESVAIAVYNCKTPVLSAVGHETDTTLVDYAADMRAPTPSSAAEIATPDKSQLLGAINILCSSLKKAMDNRIEKLDTKLLKCDSKLKLHSPQKKLNDNLNRCVLAQEKISRAIKDQIHKYENNLDKRIAMLESLSPFNVLSRGYSIAHKEKTLVRDANDLKNGDKISIRFRDNSAEFKISDIVRKEEQ